MELGDHAGAPTTLVPAGRNVDLRPRGWCPGAPVRTEDLELTPLVAGQDSFTVEYDVTYDPYGNYRMEGQIIGYGAPNMAHDVEVMDILAPKRRQVVVALEPRVRKPRGPDSEQGSDR